MRAQRKQHKKKVQHAVNEVQSVLNWSDRILYGITPITPDRKERRAVRQKTHGATDSTTTEPTTQPTTKLATRSTTTSTTTDSVRPVPGPVVNLKPGQPTRSRRPKIHLSPQTIASSSANLRDEPSQDVPRATDSTTPSYREIQRRRHQSEKRIAYRRIIKSAVVASIGGLILALILQTYVWYAAGSLIIAVEVAIFSALLVLGPPLVAIVIGLGSIRRER